jgi:hypothetical protein
MPESVAVAVGRAQSTAPFALERAAREALAGLRGTRPRAAVVLAPWSGISHGETPARVRAVVGDVPLAGGTFPSGFGAARRADDEVVVTLFGGAGVAGGCAGRAGGPAACEDTARAAVAQACDGLGGAEPALLLVFFDPQAADARAVAAGAAGACAAPLLGLATVTGRSAETCPLSVQLAGERAFAGGLAVLALGGRGLRALSATFVGEVARDRPRRVTGVTGRRVVRLDDAPALSAWSGGEHCRQALRVVANGTGDRAPHAPMVGVVGTDGADGSVVTEAAVLAGELVEVVTLDAGRAADEAAAALPDLLARLSGPPLVAFGAADPGPGGPPLLGAALPSIPLVGVRTRVTIASPHVLGGATAQAAAHALSLALVAEVPA